MAEIITSNDIIGTLPLRGNWRYRPYDPAAFTLAPGESRVIVDLRRHGWVLWGFLAHNNPDVNLTIELETETENYINSFTANTVFNAGLVQAQPNAWWVSLYNTILNAYVIAFTPAEWWPFYRRFAVTVENKTITPVTVTRAAMLCIEFVEGT